LTVRLAISVEGPTEREFCREVLQPHLHAFGVWMEPKIVVTKRNLRAADDKGGAVSVERIATEVRPLLASFDWVTTFYDFHGFRGREVGESPDALCERIAARLDRPRKLLPYVQVYEFEALLFAMPQIVGDFLECPAVAGEMSDAVALCGGAEQVNDGVRTTPSRRLEKAFMDHLRQRYDKQFHGPLLLMEIGLASIRAACPRFETWLTRLESLE